MIVLKYDICKTTKTANRTSRKTICKVENDDASRNEKINPPKILPNDSSIYALFTPNQSSSFSEDIDFAPIVNSAPHKKHPILRTENENTNRLNIDRNSPAGVCIIARTNFTRSICMSVMKGITRRRMQKIFEGTCLLLMILFPDNDPMPIHASQQQRIIPILSSLP
jgi:hypothetical protein